MKTLCLLATLCLSLTDARVVQAQDSTDDNFVIYEGHSTAMREAIDKARGTLTEALETASTGSTAFLDGFTVKVAIPAEQGTENIWVGDLRREGNAFSGRFANQPRYLPGKQIGSDVDFDQSVIIDWALPTANGKFWGHYTTRVILQNMAPEQARRIRSVLALRPAPRDW